jgi:beta-lactamase regulating signal transducer with metallopeptidase domain
MNHHLQSLGWTLVHFCWQAGTIAIFYWIADAAMSKKSSQARHLLALVSMLLMLTSAVATFTYEEMSAAPHPSYVAAGSQPDATVAAQSDLSDAIAPFMGLEASKTAKQAVQWLPSSLLWWLDIAWLVGVACLSARTIGGWRLIQRLRTNALEQVPEAVQSRFGALRAKLGITRQVQLCVSDRIRGPVAMGVFRSMVLLPASCLLALNPEQLEMVLAHELAHIRRADYFWNLIQTMIETLFFFHPAVWWLGRRIREQRELCCDDLVVEMCADPLMYATALLRLEEQRRSELDLTLAMALDGHRPQSGLRARITRLLGDAESEKESRELASLPLAAISAALLLMLLPVPQLFAGLQKTKDASDATSSLTATANPAPAASTQASSMPKPSPSIASHADIGPMPVEDSTVATTHADVLPSGSQGMSAAAGEAYGTGAASADDRAASADAEQQNSPADSVHKGDYITEMRAAGYDVDLDKYIAMKIQGITAAYVDGIVKAGLGKPSADDLIALKVQGVTPEYIAQLKAAGFAPASFGDVISDRIFNVTPEFVSGMKAAGFDAIPPKKLIELRVHGVTPQFAKTVKQQYPNATLDELVQLKIFNINDAFLAQVKQHGFTNLSIQKLVQLRISGVLNDESVTQ